MLRSLIQTIIKDYPVKLISLFKLFVSFFNPHSYFFHAISSSRYQSVLKLADRGWHDEERKSFFTVNLFKLYPAFNIHVKKHVSAACPNSFDFRFKCSVEKILVNLLPFYKLIIVNPSFEFRHGKKEI